MRLGQARLCQIGAGDLDRVRPDGDGSSMCQVPGGLWPWWREIGELPGEQSPGPGPAQLGAGLGCQRADRRRL